MNHQYEVEIKVLLGSKESRDAFKENLETSVEKLEETGKNAQLNHYFMGGNFAKLQKALEDKISAVTTKDPNKIKVYSDGYDGFTNSIDLSFGIRNKKRTFGTSISASYLFGTENSYQIVSSSFANLTLKRTSNFAFRFRPRLNFIIAKQNITLEKYVFVGGRRVLRSFNFDVFDLLNTQINLPLSLSLKSWDFELGYNLNLPNTLVNESELSSTGFFNFSIGYLFDLSK